MALGIQIVNHDPIVERFLGTIAEKVGSDLPAYRNHIYRVLTYASHFLGPDARGYEHIAFALVFHDVGMWTDNNLAYLEPSQSIAEDVRARDMAHLDAALVRNIIHWHHKLTRYRGPDEKIVEAARKADWIDATQGWCRKGIRRSAIAKVESTFPKNGFHNALLRLDKEHGDSRLAGGSKVMRGIVKW